MNKEYLNRNSMLDNLKIFPEDEVGLYSYIIKDFSFLVVTKVWRLLTYIFI